MSLVERILLVFEAPTDRATILRVLYTQLGILSSGVIETAGLNIRPELEIPAQRGCLGILHLEPTTSWALDEEAAAVALKTLSARLDQWKARTDLPPPQRLVAWVEDQRFELRGPMPARNNVPTAGTRMSFSPTLLPGDRSGEGVRVIVIDRDFSLELDAAIVPKPQYTSFVQNAQRKSVPDIDRHGDRAARIVAGARTAGGVAPGCTLWLYAVAMENIVADNGAPPLPGTTTLDLSTFVRALEGAHAAILPEAARPFSVLLTPLQFQCDTEPVRVRCREVLSAYAQKLLALDVLWVSAAGNGGRTLEYFPAELPEVVAVAAVWQDDDTRWKLNPNSCWYGKTMYGSLPYELTGVMPSLTLKETSGASSLAAGLVALLARAIPSAERTAAAVDARLRVEARKLPVYEKDLAVGEAHILDEAIALLPILQPLTGITMSSRERQKQWRQIYKSIITEDNFWQNDKPEDPDPMKSSLAHALHQEVRAYGRTWKDADFAKVLADSALASKMLADQAKINAVIARAVPAGAATPFAVTHEEAMLLFKLLVEESSFQAIAPYDPPKDNSSGPSAW